MPLRAGYGFPYYPMLGENVALPGQHTRHHPTYKTSPKLQDITQNTRLRPKYRPKYKTFTQNTRLSPKIQDAHLKYRTFTQNAKLAPHTHTHQNKKLSTNQTRTDVFLYICPILSYVE